MAKDQYNDQTQFISEEPVLESASTPPVPKEDLPEIEAAVAPKKNKKKLILIGVVGFILIIVFVLLLVLIRMANGGPGEQTPEEQLEEVRGGNGDVNPVLQEVLDLRAELENADPVTNPLPFPPVDMEMRLDPARR